MLAPAGWLTWKKFGAENNRGPTSAREIRLTTSFSPGKNATAGGIDREVDHGVGIRFGDLDPPDGAAARAIKVSCGDVSARVILKGEMLGFVPGNVDR